jgi:hypothetical protein
MANLFEKGEKVSEKVISLLSSEILFVCLSELNDDFYSEMGGDVVE